MGYKEGEYFNEWVINSMKYKAYQDHKTFFKFNTYKIIE